MSEEAQRAVHKALKEFLDEDEIAVCWCLTIEIANVREDSRYLAHRAGGGIQGTDNPMAWTALGMLQASAATAQEQVLANTRPDEDEDE